ncbi:MAG: MBL fold metallo-hydrolase [Candidatus Altiarchaeota archaeon]
MDSNAYLVIGDRACVVDPGINPARVLNHSRDYNIRMKVLINTHCHFDHVGANPDILKSGEIAAYCHESEASVYERGDGSMQLAGHFGKQPVKHQIDRALSGGDIVDLGGLMLEVLHTPGHTPGCICLFEPDSGTLITGDTVFADGVGRTDFKGGSIDDLEESLKRLAKFVEERNVKRILPGHGPEGTGDDVAEALESFF